MVLTGYPVDGSEWSEDPDGSDGGQVHILQVEAVLKGTSHNYEQVQSVPRVRQVRPRPVDTHGHHLDHHLQREEGEYEVVEELEGDSIRVFCENCFIKYSVS